MRVLFFGYSQIGYRAVKLLVEQGHDLVSVVTHHDDPEENRWYHTPAEAAQENGVRVAYSEDLGPEGVLALAGEIAPDLLLSVFYRKILPVAVLGTAKVAALNLHPSLLPAYRGRAPLNWVLVHGEPETGITLHHMVKRADAGDIVGQRRIAIAARENALSLYLKMEAAGIDLLAEMLPRVANGSAPRIQQDHSRASQFGGRRPEDGRIDWSWPAARIDCLVRAVAPPWPGAFGEIEGRRVEIHAGEPIDLLPSAGAHPAPGTLRFEGGRPYIAAGDGWFRIDQAVGLVPAHLQSTQAQ